MSRCRRLPLPTRMFSICRAMAPLHPRKPNHSDVVFYCRIHQFRVFPEARSTAPQGLAVRPQARPESRNVFRCTEAEQQSLRHATHAPLRQTRSGYRSMALPAGRSRIPPAHQPPVATRVRIASAASLRSADLVGVLIGPRAIVCIHQTYVNYY